MTTPTLTPEYTAISRETYASKIWQRFNSYGFAATITTAPVVAAELGNAALRLPLAFVQAADRFVLAAVLSLTPNRNMLVGPDGRWLGGYIPALRAYPFALLPRQGTDQLVLCIDVASGLVVESGSPGEDLFGQDGNLSAALQRVLDFLRKLESSRRATDVAVSALAQAGVIQHWSITLKTGQAERTLTGLHRADERALTGLVDEALLKLHKTAAALPIAYAQMLSMGHLPMFEQLAQLQDRLKPAAPVALPEDLGSLFDASSGETIQFR